MGIPHDLDPTGRPDPAPPFETDWDREWAEHRRLRRITGLRPLLRCLARGFARRCPNCGRGAVVVGFLQPNTACDNCGEGYAHIRTDDLAPWLSIMVLGHLILPAIISVERLWAPPLWLHLVIWLPLTIEAVIVLLPRAKGLALGLMWGLNLRGDEQTPW